MKFHFQRFLLQYLLLLYNDILNSNAKAILNIPSTLWSAQINMAARDFNPPTGGLRESTIHQRWRHPVVRFESNVPTKTR